jgi:hypothetical protein
MKWVSMGLVTILNHVLTYADLGTGYTQEHTQNGQSVHMLCRTVAYVVFTTD